jgi:predicted AAA+ superfamily ATPase
MIPRNYYIDKIESGLQNVPIVVLIGARQVGKTTIMKSIKTSKDTLFLIGQNIEIAELFQKFSIVEQYLKIYLNTELDGILFIDEFQYIQGISTQMKLLVDKYPKLKIICSGSSSLDILKNVEESLAGRVRVMEVLGLSFEEYVLFRDKQLYQLLQTFDADIQSSVLTDKINALLSEYLVYGAYPRVALIDNIDEKIDILNDIYQTYLLRDVKTYIKNEDVIGFNKMLRLLANQNGNQININNLSKESALPYKQCENYLNLLEQMYIIKLIEPYSTNKRKEVQKMKKLYFCDIGLRNMVEKNFNEIEQRSDNGALFENYVMLELWRNKGSGGIVQYYRIAGGLEIDFIMTKLNGKYAIECKYKNFEKTIMFSAMNKFCEEEKIANKFIVNKNYNSINDNGIKFLQGFLSFLIL